MSPNNRTVSYKAAIGGVAAAILVCSIFVYVGFWENERNTTDPGKDTATFIPIKHFPPIVIQARAAIVYDVKDQKILYEKNATSTLPLASITKVMTALVADKALPSTQTVEIGTSSLQIEGEDGFKENQPWKFSDLLNFTLLVSSNDGANAIANVASELKGVTFKSEMNKEAKDLGLSSMKFNNETGLDVQDENIAGGYGSALDVAKLFSYIVTKDSHLLEITRNDNWNFKALDNEIFYGNNTDTIVNKLPGILASKTGYTDLAGGNLAIAFDAGLNHPVIIVVLGSSFDGRFSDVLSLARATRKSL